ncbi:MAG: hypothetical protein ACK4GD_01455 [Sphingomonadaceae bacterium]
MYPLKIFVLERPQPGIAPFEPPVLTVDGPARPFPELLAALSQASEPDGAETGSELPQGPEVNGSILPDQSAATAYAVTLTAIPAPLALPVVPELDDAAIDAPIAGQPVLVPAKSLLTGDAQTPDTLPQQAAEPELLAEQANKSTPLRDGVMTATEQAAVLLRPTESTPPVAAARELAPAPSPTSAPSNSAVPQPAPGTQIEQLVEALALAREAGKGARGDVTVRHAEFGLVAIRLEQADGETRAQVSGRDPGFAPAVVAALSERGTAGFSDHHSRSWDQTWQQQTSGQGDSRQPDRRGSLASGRDEPAAEPRHAAARDDDRTLDTTGDRRDRFA